MIQAKVEKGSLILIVPMDAHPVASKSGKTRIVASTHGFTMLENVIVCVGAGYTTGGG